MTAEQLVQAAERMTEDAVSAALVRDTKSTDGFWLKSSLSFFPNSKMNHLSNPRKDDGTIAAAVRKWRSPPEQENRPGVECVLCGRDSVGFYGKVDVPLAESNLYRNSTPRGQCGTALCWPCLCAFHALPYGCRLTGGPSIALHSWDERFMARTVSRRVDENRRLIALEKPSAPSSRTREVLALHALRRHEDRLTAGVELLVFSNNNRGQTLEIQSMEQPIAEWLRRSARVPERRRGFRALLKAHVRDGRPGVVGLARNAFRSPELIVGACGRYMAYRPGDTKRREDIVELAELCLSFVVEVMHVKQSEVDQINALGRQLAAWFVAKGSAGELRKFNATLRDGRRMRHWLRRTNLDALLDPKKPVDGPLISEAQFRMLFDPEEEQAWLHRELLIVALSQYLHELEFDPTDRAEVAAEIADEDDHPEDNEFIEGED
ncbi:hypothetical protein SAMN05421505_10611 [Sinosporangium album]|uniref:CRISPR-associated protein Cst1 n=1 Tax=Sinosporangium album TaxID=504805 RepID=A0A1G7VU72_9ACTN|nr:hypothetical protein [Sinosporangium album]SDG62450.1 hypothetical protein SAMN05421505_10611 [Sinosporangium album]